MPNLIDLTGKTFGELTVIKRAEDRIQPSGQHCRMWLCNCSCGETCIVSGQNLRSGHTKSCGHLQKEAASTAHLKDLKGMTFGELFVLEEAGRYISPDGHKQAMWKCVCTCHKEVIVNSHSLVSGATRSCGHIKRKDIAGQIFGWLLAIKPGQSIVGEDGEWDTTWTCECLNCGGIKDIRTSSLLAGVTKSDGCLGSSWNEIQIKELLTKLKVKHKKEQTFDDLKAPDTNKHLRFDFSIKDNKGTIKGLIEFHGPHHYLERFKNWGDRQRLVTDPIKEEYCKKNNIPLLIIKYTQKEFKQDILQFLDSINVSYVNPVPSSE